MQQNIKNQEEKLQDNYKEIPNKVTVILSGEQALQVLLSIAAYAKQGLERGLVTVKDWEEREKILNIFIEATNCPIQCPKYFVKNLEEVLENIVSVK